MEKAFKLTKVKCGICTHELLSVAQIYNEFLAVLEIFDLVPALFGN